MDFIGSKPFMLKVIEPIERPVMRGMWRCICDCGNEAIVRGDHIKNGRTKSCGCIPTGFKMGVPQSHGQTCGKQTPAYTSWGAMLDRCYRQKAANYHNYGGRGVTVCQEWRNSFENFYADMGDRPDGKTLDRWPDKNGNYEPSNCRWATAKEQSNNRRAHGRYPVKD